MHSNAAHDVARIYGVRLSRLERALVEKREVFRQQACEVDAVKEVLRKNAIERDRIIGNARLCVGIVRGHQLRELSTELSLADEEIDRTSARLEQLLAAQQQSKQAFETTRAEYLRMQHKRQWLRRQIPSQPAAGR